MERAAWLCPAEGSPSGSGRGAAMPEVQGAMEATLRAILDGDGVDRGVLEGLNGAAQRYHAIKALANLSKYVPGLQGVSLGRA